MNLFNRTDVTYTTYLFIYYECKQIYYKLNDMHLCSAPGTCALTIVFILLLIINTIKKKTNTNRKLRLTL